MTAALLLLILASAYWLWFYKSFFGEPKSERVCMDFRAPLKHGTLIATIAYTGDHLPIDYALRRWAIRLENPTLPLDDALQAILPYGIVINVALDCPNLPPVKPPKPSMADSLVQTIKAKAEAAEAIAHAAGIDTSDINGASLKVHNERFAKAKIKDLYDHPDHW